MRTHRGLRWSPCIALTLALLGCAQDHGRSTASPQPQSATPTADFSDEQTRTITLLRDEPGLPALPGRELVVFSCSTCHSTRYITMQPPLPRTVWTAEVRKMMAAFGAPVTETQVPQIAEYLVTIQQPK